MKKITNEIKNNEVGVTLEKSKSQKDFAQKLLDDVKGGGRWLKWIKNH